MPHNISDLSQWKAIKKAEKIKLFLDPQSDSKEMLIWVKYLVRNDYKMIFEDYVLKNEITKNNHSFKRETRRTREYIYIKIKSSWIQVKDCSCSYTKWIC
jgi:hypothetical protein